MSTCTSEPSPPSIELDRQQAPNRRRFARFAAAMEAGPPPMAQTLNAAIQTTVARRPGARARSVPGIVWLGIGSWTIFCGSLFLSLLLWDRDAFEASLAWPGQISERATVSDLREAEDRRQQAPNAGLPELLPPKEEAAIPEFPFIPQTSPRPHE